MLLAYLGVFLAFGCYCYAIPLESQNLCQSDVCTKYGNLIHVDYSIILSFKLSIDVIVPILSEICPSEY